MGTVAVTPGESGTVARRATALASLLVAVALAGCTSDDGGGAASPVGDDEPTLDTGIEEPLATPINATLVPALALGDCLELHAIHPWPIDAMPGSLPPGFRFTPDASGRLGTVFSLAARCAGGNLTGTPDDDATMGETALGAFLLAVVPPAELANASVDMEWLLFYVFYGAPEVRAYFETANMTGVLGGDSRFTFTSTVAPGTARVETAVWDFDGSTSTSRLVLQPSSNVRADLVSRIWVGTSDGLQGHFVLDHGDWTEFGSGASYFSDPLVRSGPPILPGTGRAVSPTAQHWTYVPVAAD